MGRGREFRDSGRRGFDDDFGQRRADFFEPRAERGSFGGGAPMAPRPVGGPAVDAVVKWFNSEKGFGFVEVADGSGDAFLHIRAVEAAGYSDLQPGTRLEVRTAQGQKGPQVTEVISVDTSTAEAPAPRMGGGGFGAGPGGPGARRPPRPGFGAGGGAPRHTGPTTELAGTVKWYNPTKGFGFIVAEDGGKDVFIHRSVLMRANLPDLIEGQPVRMGVVDGMKGREAATIELGDA
ncbi:cold-shock protein [Salinarimonas ramus]|nr:cold shock domain-containing protein [Salinarimonas ramus]